MSPGSVVQIVHEDRHRNVQLLLELTCELQPLVERPRLLAEDAVAAVRKLNGGKGVDYVVECSGAPNAVNEAIRMVNRGGKVCLAAFPHEETPVDVAHIVRNNIYLYGIRGEGKSATHRAEAFMSQKRFDATKVHTHTFPLEDLPTAIKYARERIDDAIKVVVKTRGSAAQRVAAE